MGPVRVVRRRVREAPWRPAMRPSIGRESPGRHTNTSVEPTWGPGGKHRPARALALVRGNPPVRALDIARNIVAAALAALPAAGSLSALALRPCDFGAAGHFLLADKVLQTHLQLPLDFLER